MAGREALKAALDGDSGIMIGFKRTDSEDGSYHIEPFRVPIEEVMMYEKEIPESYINARGNDVTDEFVQWAKPLIGGDLPEFTRLEKYEREKKL